MQHIRYFSLIFIFLLFFESLSLCASIESNENVDLALDSGKIVVLYFWQSDCPSCDSVDVSMTSIETMYGDSIVLFRLNLDQGETVLETRYSVSVTPTVVIFDSLGRIFDTLAGAKTLSYYIDRIDAAFAVEGGFREEANKYYDNALLFFNIEKYSNAKQYFMKARELYSKLGDVTKTILCDQFVQKSDNYVDATSYLEQADDSFLEEDYVLAKSNYNVALSYYLNLNDLDKIDYCNLQIDKCDLYPSLEENMTIAQRYVYEHKYASAKVALIEIRNGYEQLGEEEKVVEIENTIKLCSDYILANQYFSDATTAINNKNYEVAISNFIEAKNIYISYNDEEKIMLCDQNIAIANQLLDLQTSTTPPPNGLETDYSKYYPYAAFIGFCVLILSGIIIYYTKRKKNKLSVSSFSSKVPAIDRISKQLDISSDKNTIEETEILSEEEDKESSFIPEDPFNSYKSNTIESKNELLSNFLQWAEELVKELDNANSKDYFIYRDKLDQLYSFFTRSFSSDEAYLDKDLLSLVNERIHICQTKLTDLIDII